MQPAAKQSQPAPVISVIMANFEAGEKIVLALRSVLDQTMADLEVIVSDDASRDDSVARVRAMMADDPRIRLVANETNRGPAPCRNAALELARGNWVAVVDSDDIIHPERFERLLAVAAAHDADIVADNLLLFHDDGTLPRLMLDDESGASFAVSPRDWVLAGLDGAPALGYLKPMIRADRLQKRRYDENLRIGEDYDFILRLLLADARMVVVRDPFYLYRRHSGSISHRLSVQDMRAMVERQQALVAEAPPVSSALAAAFARRLSVLRAGLSYELLVASIKQRHLGQALGRLAREPAHVQRLWSSLLEGRQRRAIQQPDTRTKAQRPEPMVLGANGMPGADQIVPDYIPARQVDWSVPRPQRLWRELAGYAGGRCVALDAAGRYAAGFIPEVRLEERPVLQAAS